MSRFPQPEGVKGSLKWIQRAIAVAPEVIQPEALPTITWVSPLANDQFAEYRDSAFLERIGLGHLTPELARFWPTRGPQWDALGTTETGVVLVEAKAHIGEFQSPGTAAGGNSRRKIVEALEATKRRLGIKTPIDWSGTFYQYTNRLAHLAWLSEQGLRADLVFVSFIGDDEVRGPKDATEWKAAFADADRVLGIPAEHRRSKNVHHVYPDVSKLTLR